MNAAAEYLTGALVVALVALAILFVVRAYQAIRRHYRCAARDRADGWVTVDALRARTASRTPAGPIRAPKRVGPAGTSSRMQSPQ